MAHQDQDPRPDSAPSMNQPLAQPAKPAQPHGAGGTLASLPGRRLGPCLGRRPDGDLAGLGAGVAGQRLRLDAGRRRPAGPAGRGGGGLARRGGRRAGRRPGGGGGGGLGGLGR